MSSSVQRHAAWPGLKLGTCWLVIRSQLSAGTSLLCVHLQDCIPCSLVAVPAQASKWLLGVSLTDVEAKWVDKGLRWMGGAWVGWKNSAANSSAGHSKKSATQQLERIGWVEVPLNPKKYWARQGSILVLLEVTSQAVWPHRLNEENIGVCAQAVINHHIIMMQLE